MCFMPVTDPNTVKNRLYFDLASVQNRNQEIERLLAPGAPGRHRADWRRVLDGVG
jgi:hypothetical protein